MNTFHTDEDVNGRAIKLARALGVRIITTADAGLIDADDPVHLSYAVEHGYVMVIVNVRDYAPLARKILRDGGNHPGIVLITSRHPKNAIHIARELLKLSERSLINQEIWI